MGVLGWASSPPWLSRILGFHGPNDRMTWTREAGCTQPELPGNSYRRASGGSRTAGEAGPTAPAESPSLRLTTRPFSLETHFAVNPALYLQLRPPEWKKYEQQERVFVVVSATGRLWVYVDRTCSPVIAAIHAYDS